MKEICNWTGFISFGIFYFFVSEGKIKADSRMYHVLNVMICSVFIAYQIQLKEVPYLSVTLNSIFVTQSIYKLIKLQKK